jgi:hypothetical protein
MTAPYILLDSISERGYRLTTFVVTLPRFVLAEFNTHRALSRNAASSRAIPITRSLAECMANPVIPAMMYNEQGMQSSVPLTETDRVSAERVWLAARDAAYDCAEKLNKLNVHKQFANRVLEPFKYVTLIASATDWANFFALRCHKAAQPEFRSVARRMLELYLGNTPTVVQLKDWHLPFISAEERAAHPISTLKRVSTARCARISYLTHDGKRDINKDLELYDKLCSFRPLHASPAEHVATPTAVHCKSGNFTGWAQHRKELVAETVHGAPASLTFEDWVPEIPNGGTTKND